MEGDSASVSSNPVINFTVKNQNGQGYAGLVPNDLRFTIAKLTPGPAAGMPSNWQNYILTTQTASAPGAPGFRTMVQGTRETPSGSADPSAGPPFPPGTLVNYGNGQYTYTFATDITQGQALCPAPCLDAWDRPLDLSYNASLTHRIGVQTRGGNAPNVNLAFDFVPAGGPVTTRRDIVKTESCNECHNKLELHDERIETKYCVTCHNRGSTDPDSERMAKTTPAGQSAYVLASGAVDFKQMIHKIHRGEFLPSVEGCSDPPPGCNLPGGEEYAIWGYGNSKHDFSTVVFPQPIVNCTKCHDGTDAETPQGNNWNDVPSIEACGACHDNIIFDAPLGTTNGHPGGPVNFNTNCTNCHAAGLIGHSPAEAHVNHEKIAAGKFKFNILEICGVAVDMNPVCAPGANPTVKFSVEDPTGAGGHQYGDFYNVRSTGTDPEFTSGSASLSILVAWETRDYNNTDGAGARPARAESTNARTSAAVADNMDGTFTFTSPNQIPPNGGPNGYSASGSGTIGIEGHPAADFDGDGTFGDRAPATSEVAYFGITDATPVPRRVVVDAPTKCANCHDILSLHGGNRNNNTQVCVLCHNPKNTDIGQRGGMVGIDGKLEEGIDFKRLIHAIHAGEADEHGFREEGIVVYGYGGNSHDYGHVRFPGILNDCETCHVDDTYTLENRSGSGGANWEQPAQNGILGSIIDTGADDALRSDDRGISPTAAVCSACHDGAVEQEHMTALGGALFLSDQTAIQANIETCVVCHGSGALADVEVVHAE
jgi:OmcA/MtrC family decaheme c-type cytochrome